MITQKRKDGKLEIKIRGNKSKERERYLVESNDDRKFKTKMKKRESEKTREEGRKEGEKGERKEL